MAQHAAAYPHKVNKVTISGTCFAGIEEWSTGFYIGDTGADAADPGTTTASAVAALWTTFFTSANAHIAPSHKTTHVKVSQLQLNGDTDLDKIDIYDYPTPIVGVSGGNPMPPQITLAATVTSDNQRGLASKGRMYLPGVNLPIFTADPRVSVTEQTQITTALKTFLDGVNASSAIAGYAILASKGHKLVIAEDPKNWYYVLGKIGRVTGVRVGNVYDTQRRRRGGVTEAYTSAVLA